MKAFLSVLAFATCGLAAHIIPESSAMFRHCVGPACPTYSLPMTIDKPGVHHKMNCSKGDVVKEEGSCQKFYICPKNHTAIKLKCTNGYALDSRTKLCVMESRMRGCGKVYCPPSLMDGLVPDPGNCTRYYRCMYGMPIHYQCDPEQIYNHDEGRCIDYDDYEVPQCVNAVQQGKPLEGPLSTPKPAEDVVTSTLPPALPIAPVEEDMITEEPLVPSVPSKIARMMRMRMMNEQ